MVIRTKIRSMQQRIKTRSSQQMTKTRLSQRNITTREDDSRVSNDPKTTRKMNNVGRRTRIGSSMERIANELLVSQLLLSLGYYSYACNECKRTITLRVMLNVIE